MQSIRHTHMQLKILSSRRTSQHGSSLLEVLIAVLILAIGMLGMAALQSITLKNTNSSSARSQAIIQTYSLFDTLRLNRTLAATGTYNVSSWTCEAATAAAGSTADYGVFNTWLGQVQATLGDPAACGRLVCVPAESSCEVAIKWDDSRATGGTIGVPQTVSTFSRL